MLLRRTPLLLSLWIGLFLGPALADGIDIGGTAQMGLIGTTDPMGDRRTQLLYDLDLTLRLMRTTDGGLTFGLQIDLDEMLNGASGPERLPEREGDE